MKVLFKRIFRVLKIANTVFFGFLFVGFIAWWVRSFYYFDGGYFSTFPNQHTAFHGGNGRMCVWFEHSAAPEWFSLDSRINDDAPIKPEDRIPIFDLAPFWPTMTRLYVAHWFLAISALVFAVIPWCPRKFSIRGMLITVTIVCVVVAAISWVDTTFQ